MVLSFLSFVSVKRLSRRKTQQLNDKSELPSLSILIAARNEGENLVSNLPKVLEQDYSNFEVIVIDDRSTDNTRELMAPLLAKYLRLKIIDANKQTHFPGKKNAIATGIKSANFDYLVFTDADCTPASIHWLKCFGESFANGKQMVIGFGLFEKENRLVNVMYRLGAMRIALRYLTSAVLFHPYMAVGRSMAYTKSLFKNVGGFARHEHISSGDDDLFVQSVPDYSQCEVLLQASTVSQAPNTWRDWLIQKKRHLGAGKNYSVWALIALIIIEFTDLISIVGFGYLGISQNFDLFPLLSLLILIRFFIYMASILKMKSIMPYKSVSAKEILLDPVLSLLNPLFSVVSQLWQSQEWNRKK